MLMNQILDSSHATRDPDEQRSRALKRSTSVASLPTPPRTKHKRSRTRARSFASHVDSDGTGSELDHDHSGDDAKHIKRAKTTRDVEHPNDDGCSEGESPDRKKRRTLRVLPGHDEDEEDENAFWTGRAVSHREKPGKGAEAEETEAQSPSPALLHYRVKAPVSPPPSRRPPVVQPARASSVERDLLPVTPPRRLFVRGSSPVVDVFKTPTKSAVTKILPERDSPNNPFLVESSEKAAARSGWDSSDDEEEVVGEVPVLEGTPTPTHEEKPTITYVFRGQKATFHNPLYGLAPEVVAASKLPMEHPDYEATEACPPKRLFVSAGKRRSRDRSREGTSTLDNKRVKVRPSEDEHQPSDGEESGPRAETHNWPIPDSETVSSKPACEISSNLADTKEDGAREARERREAAAKVRLAPRDGLRAGAVIAERDEPARRALGPVRSA